MLYQLSHVRATTDAVNCPDVRKSTIAHRFGHLQSSSSPGYDDAAARRPRAYLVIALPRLLAPNRGELAAVEGK